MFDAANPDPLVKLAGEEAVKAAQQEARQYYATAVKTNPRLGVAATGAPLSPREGSGRGAAPTAKAETAMFFINSLPIHLKIHQQPINTKQYQSCSAHKTLGISSPLSLKQRDFAVSNLRPLTTPLDMVTTTASAAIATSSLATNAMAARSPLCLNAPTTLSLKTTVSSVAASVLFTSNSKEGIATSAPTTISAGFFSLLFLSFPLQPFRLHDTNTINQNKLIFHPHPPLELLVPNKGSRQQNTICFKRSSPDQAVNKKQNNQRSPCKQTHIATAKGAAL